MRETDFPGAAYDNWKLATPPEHDDKPDEEPEDFDESGDDDYEWERPALSELMDEEIDSV